MAVRNDNSIDKSVTVRIHSSGTSYSAPVSSFIDKTDGMRVQVFEPITGKTYYFVFPYASYKNLSDTTTMEIPFNKDGTPAKQRASISKNGIPNWWEYQVLTAVTMVTTVICNDSLVPTKSNFHKLFEEQED